MRPFGASHTDGFRPIRIRDIPANRHYKTCAGPGHGGTCREVFQSAGAEERGRRTRPSKLPCSAV